MVAPENPGNGRNQNALAVGTGPKEKKFEREIAGERIRDKIAASKAKGMWMGGNRAARL